MSEAPSQAQSNTPSQPRLPILPQNAEDFLGELIDKRLQQMGVPQTVASEMTETIEKAAKKVPSWVLWIIVSFAPTLGLGIYSQYQAYKDIPAKMVALELTQTMQGQQLNRIEDLLSPTSRPK